MANSSDSKLLDRAVETSRVHSAYLVSGVGEAPRQAVLAFARGLSCSDPKPAPCERCSSCQRSADKLGADGELEAVTIDGTGKKGPLYRHIGDHPDLLWTERDSGSTRVRIGQIRAIQHALRLGANEGGWRVAVIADAELLNVEAQNALLHLLEEPPDRTCIVLLTASASGLLATIRSRCQRVRFVQPELELRSPDNDPEVLSLVERLDGIAEVGLPGLLDWAEEYRGPRGPAAESVQALLETGSAWLRERAGNAAAAGGRFRGEIDAFHVLSRCRRELVQRNANPQMVAERALIAVRKGLSQ